MSSLIPNPCHENWNAMKPCDGGRFCDSCQHKVVDLSRFTEKEQVQWLKGQEQSVCISVYSGPKWAKYFYQRLERLSLLKSGSVFMGIIFLLSLLSCRFPTRTTGKVIPKSDVRTMGRYRPAQEAPVHQEEQK